MAARCDFRRACTYCKTYGHEEEECPRKLRQARLASRRDHQAQQEWHEMEHAAYLERVAKRQELAAKRQELEAKRQELEAKRQERAARAARQLAAFQAREAERKAAHDATMYDKEVNDAASESTAVTLSSDAGICEGADREVRKLQKKLHEIGQLQQRSDAGEHLDRLQVKKIEQRSAVQAAFAQALAKADELAQHAGS